jgi:L-ascorbate metabolism protein UlaG (beta-lactamase superfamily)
LNSGFIVESEVGRWALIFDAYRDMRGDVERALSSAEKVYFFVSHAHFDHFNPSIARYEKAAKFFLSEDIRSLYVSRRFPKEKTVWIGKYDGWKEEGLCIESFDSTDEGTSFLWRQTVGAFFMPAISTGGIGKMIRRTPSALLGTVSLSK